MGRKVFRGSKGGTVVSPAKTSDGTCKVEEKPK